MLRLQHVSAGYGGPDVVRDVSFDVSDGENLCILGPNGCGKTTLLRAIAALLPSRGDIEIDGRSIRRMKRREIAANIAVMSQFSGIYFSYTVYDTVMLGRYQHMRRGLLPAPAQEDKACVEDCLAATGLSDLRDRQIDELSGGQLQRVFLARTLAQQPRIILLDEPTNHLDLKHQAELVEYLKAWSQREGHTVVGVLHDINLALRLSDRVLFMKDGEVIGAGKAKEVISPAFLQRVYGMDVAGYMRESLRKWEEFQHV